ncbi:protein HESO1-like [Argentina anserina]|uniref:protein HESO1-like n=1 Tax=Argentina anserina TaxID=57926 RepID=UPI0021766A7F|nr:protein HESO1-like [Potentilla anserina]XP_050386165.1 protein HESO1-like [Potentilla anserina]
MNAHIMLDNTLNQILRVLKPSIEDWETRLRILQELQGAVESVEGLRGATVEPFGSFVSNLYACWGDLDVSIEFSKGTYISEYGKKHKEQLLGVVMRAMTLRGGWKRIQLIPTARVPILKAESYLQNIACDISINNLKGQMKSKILFCIGEIDGRFRDMVLLVKEWAKAQNMNNPRFGSFNSYALTLLVVFHFQTCTPAILPPLREIYPGNLTDDLQGLRADAEKHIEETCIANITRFKSDKLGAENTSSLSQLFISFLQKFSDLVMNTRKSGICTYTGQWEDILSNMTWLPQTYTIMIEDPFDQPENCSRAVSMGELRRISEAFKTSSHILMSATQNDILATLVRPLTYRLVAGRPHHQFEHRHAAYPQHFMTERPQSRTPRGNYVPRQPCRPQVQKWAQRPSKMQPQFQKTEAEKHSDMPTFQETKPESHPNPTLETSQDCACGMCVPVEYIQ